MASVDSLTLSWILLHFFQNSGHSFHLRLCGMFFSGHSLAANVPQAPILALLTFSLYLLGPDGSHHFPCHLCWSIPICSLGLLFTLFTAPAL